MRMIRNLIIMSTFFFFGWLVLGLALPALDCYGWDCQIITCPKTYALEIPEKGYIKCEDIDEFITTENEDLLIK